MNVNIYVYVLYIDIYIVFSNLQIQPKKNDTPPKITIKPENDGLEDEFPLPGVYSQVPC